MKVNRFYFRKPILKKKILHQVQKEDNIIYGAQSIKKQLGVRGRQTFDYDIYSNTPRKSANRLERTGDRLVKANLFFSKPAMHPGTYKVKFVGRDMKPNTRDDVDIADFTKKDKGVKYIIIDGIKYRILSEELKAKQKALADKTQKFRWAKDKNDADRIKAFLNQKSCIVALKGLS